MKVLKIVYVLFLSFLFIPSKSVFGFTDMQVDFQRACLAGLKDNVVEYLKEDPSLIHFRFPSEMTALHYAAGKGHLELAQILLQKGADINSRDIDLKTPLHFAAFFQHEKLVSILLYAGADFNLRDKNEEYPIENAIKPDTLTRSMKTVNAFYEFNENLINWNHMRRFLERIHLNPDLLKELQNLCILRDYRKQFFAELNMQ